jgi:transcriptional regulator with PAS, ATPase and Fis domain
VYSESVTLKVLESKKATTIIQKAKNGNEILATGTPVFTEGGQIDKIVVNSRDITDLNNLNRELSLKEELAEKYREELELLRLETFGGSVIVSKSTVMQKVFRLAATVSKVESTVLITGESGVGKGVLAQFIHNNSGRKKGPFIKIDCSAIPETLFESELFGYEKGAFTGAEKGGKVGLFELAQGGTVFLDEVGELPLSMQPKIMRAIQDKEIVSVGGDKVKKLDIRIMAATNMDLNQMVIEKLFREDLYYRLNVVPIKIPPLKERKEDILPLIRQVMERMNRSYNWNKRLSAEALDALINYSWPGNVRELENLVERMMVSEPGDTIDIAHIPAFIWENENRDKSCTYPDKGDYKASLAKYDQYLITKAIEEEGSIPKAAKKLGINVTTVRRKLEKYESNEQ